MIINNSNIDKWLFDYFEGNLSTHEKIELEHFLQNHPEYDIDFETWKDTFAISKPYTPSYSAPQHLYQNNLTTKQKLIRGVLSVLTFAFVVIGVTKYSIDTPATNNTIPFVKSSSSFPLYHFKLNDILSYISPNSITTQKNNLPLLFFSLQHNTTKQNNNKQNNNHYHNTTSSVLLPASLIHRKNISYDTKISSTTSNDTQIHTTRTNTQLQLLHIEHKKASPIHIKAINKKLSTPVFNNDKSLTKKQTYSYLEYKRQRRTKKRQQPNPNYPEKNTVRKKSVFDIDWEIYHQRENNKKKNKLATKLAKLSKKEIALLNTHDPVFILPISNPLYNNPSISGGLERPRIKTGFIAQQDNESLNSITTSIISGDLYLQNLNAGVGILYSNKNYSDINTNSKDIGISYAQRLQIGDESSITLGVTVQQNSIKKSPVNLDFSSTYISPLTSNLSSLNNYSYTSTNLSSSMWYDGKFFYGGITGKNLFLSKKANNNEKLFVEYINPVKFAIQLGTDYRKTPFSATVFSAQINYIRYKNEGDLWLGTTVKHKCFVAGIGGTVNNSYKATLGIQGKRLRLLYGFRYTKSVSNYYFETHNLSLRYVMKSSKHKH